VTDGSGAKRPNIASAPQGNGKSMSAFVRAREPAARPIPTSSRPTNA
jgi:hypothetical protein